MNLVYTVQVLKSAIALYLFFYQHITFYLSKHSISPFLL